MRNWKKERKQLRVMNWNSLSRTVFWAVSQQQTLLSPNSPNWRFSQTKTSDLNALISEIVHPLLSNPLLLWGCIWTNKINRISGETNILALWVVLSMWTLLTRYPHNYGYSKAASLTISPRSSYNNEHQKNHSAGLINACWLQTCTAISRNCSLQA